MLRVIVFKIKNIDQQPSSHYRRCLMHHELAANPTAGSAPPLQLTRPRPHSNCWCLLAKEHAAGQAKRDKSRNQARSFWLVGQTKCLACSSCLKEGGQAVPQPPTHHTAKNLITPSRPNSCVCRCECVFPFLLPGRRSHWCFRNPLAKACYP